jgi:hypothetical protein
MRPNTVRLVLSAALLAALATTAVAFALPEARGAHSHHLSLRRPIASEVLRVLRRHAAHASDAGSSSGVLALTQGNFTASVLAEPGNNGVCLVLTSPNETSGTACATLNEVAEKGLTFLSEGMGQASRLTILLPNGAHSVVATTSSGATLPMPIVNNVASRQVEDLQQVNYVMGNETQVSWRPPPEHELREALAKRP